MAFFKKNQQKDILTRMREGSQYADAAVDNATGMFKGLIAKLAAERQEVADQIEASNSYIADMQAEQKRLESKEKRLAGMVTNFEKLLCLE